MRGGYESHCFHNVKTSFILLAQFLNSSVLLICFLPTNRT